MEIFTSHDDKISVEPETDGRVRFTINDVSIVMPSMTAAIVSVNIQQIIKGTYKTKRKTLRPNKKPDRYRVDRASFVCFLPLNC